MSGHSKLCCVYPRFHICIVSKRAKTAKQPSFRPCQHAFQLVSALNNCNIKPFQRISAHLLSFFSVPFSSFRILSACFNSFQGRQTRVIKRRRLSSDISRSVRHNSQFSFPGRISLNTSKHGGAWLNFRQGCAAHCGAVV